MFVQFAFAVLGCLISLNALSQDSQISGDLDLGNLNGDKDVGGASQNYAVPGVSQAVNPETAITFIQFGVPPKQNWSELINAQMKELEKELENAENPTSDVSQVDTVETFQNWPVYLPPNLLPYLNMTAPFGTAPQPVDSVGMSLGQNLETLPTVESATDFSALHSIDDEIVALPTRPIGNTFSIVSNDGQSAGFISLGELGGKESIQAALPMGYSVREISPDLLVRSLSVNSPLDAWQSDVPMDLGKSVMFLNPAFFTEDQAASFLEKFANFGSTVHGYAKTGYTAAYGYAKQNVKAVADKVVDVSMKEFVDNMYTGAREIACRDGQVASVETMEVKGVMKLDVDLKGVVGAGGSYEYKFSIGIDELCETVVSSN